MTTIVSKEVVGDYVHLVLSNGEQINIQNDWATKFVQESYVDADGNTQWRDTTKSLLQYEIEQATVLANQREADKQVDLTAAEDIISKV